MNDETRPNPDSLLDLVSHDRSLSARGRLKLFFGASAGVGKTYAMLAESRRKLSDGLDVVIGVVETHGREETAALLEGIPQIPLRAIQHRGVPLFEFDLEAVLERKPSLILMDELAHTNAPGSRHPKRWQDVEELLSRGIDVYTTLNVQHLESINDMVTKLTGVVVKETVPDSVFETADDIALIDIPSDELLRRLAEGKVYVAEGANKRAAENFFKKSNLVALRELALRRTAERVDAEGDILTASRGQREAQLGQKILVCVGHDMLSTRVIRHAKRMATRAKAPWYAMYVETLRHEHLTEKARLLAERNLRLAERLGGRIIRIAGDNAKEEILNYAHKYGFTRIVLGHKQRPAPWRWLRSSLSSELIAEGLELEITTVTEANPKKSSYTSFWRYHMARPYRYLLALGILMIASLIGLPFRDVTDIDNLTMLYLTAVVLIAAWLGTGPSMLASLLSVVAFNFFFTQPYYTFEFYNKGYYFTFAVMLTTSLIVGSLAARLSVKVHQSRRREAETDTLFALTRELSTLRTSIADAALKYIRGAFEMEAVIFTLKEGTLIAVPEDSPACELKEESVVRWVMQNRQIAGRGTDTLPSARGIYVPMMAENETLGVLGVIPPDEAHEFSSAEINRLETFASLIASSLQRTLRTEAAEERRLEAESEKLRSVMLSSLSHDLRTPLASIATAASSLLMSEEPLSNKTRSVLASIQSQSSRLTRIVTNLLDITRLELGQLSLNRQPYFLEEVIGAALSEVEDFKEQRMIATFLNAENRSIEIDGLLIEQVFVNLLENAIKFTTSNGKIMIRVDNHAEGLLISVEDNGRGIPDAISKRIFDKFFIFDEQTGSGTGLGLAICRAIVELHGGRIWADQSALGGAMILFTLPRLSPHREEALS